MKKDWHIAAGGSKHRVRLDYTADRAKVWLDDKLVHEGPGLGMAHEAAQDIPLPVSEAECVLHIRKIAVTLVYVLSVDGLCVETGKPLDAVIDEQLRAGKRKGILMLPAIGLFLIFVGNDWLWNGIPVGYIGWACFIGGVIAIPFVFAKTKKPPATA